MTCSAARPESGAFVTRACNPCDHADVNAVVYLWLASYHRSWFGKHSGLDRAAFFALERARILEHITRDDVTLAVDAEDAGIIYGLACTTGDTVHYAMVKRDVANAGFSRALFQLMLGDRLTRPCPYTSELNDMVSAQVLPRYWYLDGGWYFREREAE